MKTLSTLLAGSALILASGAAAQTTAPEAEAMPQMPSQELPDDSAVPKEPAMNDAASDDTFSDAEIESFAAAALKIQSLNGDEAAKQQQAADIVAQSGIDPETFNAIGTAMQTDPALADRVRTAAAEMQPQPAG
ncbi:DUF4168 domain-containing protein [Erythrobacter vulgaris]|uniref:DUF4168 domain-containing protein n=1 Tax=Qipengyuania vulgaris TaxID=291985 RepID=A0A844XR87_9SPHN|nr:DUF4168 domain-containing protein [Qipengyuania vulgaris]MXO47683.1 DUF4168 domain-containing protein [Qipengyuania vulgaris]